MVVHATSSDRAFYITCFFLQPPLFKILERSSKLTVFWVPQPDFSNPQISFSSRSILLHTKWVEDHVLWLFSCSCPWWRAFTALLLYSQVVRSDNPPLSMKQALEILAQPNIHRLFLIYFISRAQRTNSFPLCFILTLFCLFVPIFGQCEGSMH